MDLWKIIKKYGAFELADKLAIVSISTKKQKIYSLKACSLNTYSLMLLKYIINRILISLVIIFAVLSLTFLIINLAPGDPSSMYITPEISPETVKLIRHQMGLDRPLWIRYICWLREFASGNFGISFSQMRPVSDIMRQATFNTLQLTIVVFIVQMVLGVFIGLFSAIKQNTKIDRGINSILLIFYSVPGFWLALMVILIFSLKLGWLPSSQMKSLLVVDGFLLQFWDRVKHMILPVTVLSLPFIAYTARFVRGSVIEIMGQDYIRTAKAYGINNSKILYQYVLKNALLPLMTLIGLFLPFILGGSVITDNIFSWPGMGQVTVQAIFAHDYPIILASNFIAALTVVTGNLISDILYCFVDPRIKI